MVAFPGEVHIRSATKLYIQSAHKIRLSVADPKLGRGGAHLWERNYALRHTFAIVLRKIAYD